MDPQHSPIDLSRYRIESGTGFSLDGFDPGETGPYGDSKKDARKDLQRSVERLDALQRLLWAQGRHKLLVVFQAMDTGGKDGAIRKVFGRLNPQGVSVANFKKPTSRELGHDYLWRVHAHTPSSGRITVFNRSHYEDVLIVRVLGLVPEEQWARRYRHIREFEMLLADEGTTILKFFLNISNAEQRRRLQSRLDNPDKRWKFNRDDLEHRALWADYMAAYETAIAETSRPQAPWYVVPSNHKWFRDIVIATAVEQALGALPLEYPDSDEGLESIEIT